MILREEIILVSCFKLWKDLTVPRLEGSPEDRTILSYTNGPQQSLSSVQEVLGKICNKRAKSNLKVKNEMSAAHGSKSTQT